METVTCTGCSLLCDDIKVVVENGRIVKNFGCCTVGTEKINLLSSPERLTNPKVQGLNQSLPVEEMAEKVAEMLKASRCPLLYGWCNSTCEAIGLGLKMAEKLGGVFDSPLSLYHGYAIMHAKKLGAYKVTLDDVREEADHIIFWGANPAETFHRHMSKFSVFPRGERVERGYYKRTFPHFKLFDISLEAKGFVSRGFRHGLTPFEFFFDAMNSREGLMDKSLRTRHSGYMERRLVGALQDLKVEYDGTVRDSSGKIIQFVAGEDGLDPSKIEKVGIDVEGIARRIAG